MRRVFPFICVLLFISTCTFGILYFSDMEKYEETIVESDTNTSVLRSTVESGVITSTLEIDAQVFSESPDAYLERITVNFLNNHDKSTFKTERKLGDVLKNNDILYSMNNKTTTVNFEGKIVDIIYGDNNVEFYILNFDKLYIVGKIDIDKLDVINNNAKVSIVINQKQKEQEYKAEIKNFGYEVIDNKVDVMVNYEPNLLPGTPAKIKFEITGKNKSLYILSKMLMKEDSNYYVYVEQTNGERIQREIELGESFSEFDGENEIEYVEVLSGLEKDEKLIIDVVE